MEGILKRRIAGLLGIPVLAVLLLGLLIGAVRFVDGYYREGEFFTPGQPVAKEPARFRHFLKSESGDMLRDAEISLDITKVRSANPLFFTSYLPLGPVLQSDVFVSDGQLNLDAVFWDEGSYRLTIEGSNIHGGPPFFRQIPIEVKPSLTTYRNEFLLIAGVIFAGFISGRIGANLRRARPTIGTLSVALLMPAVFSAVLGVPDRLWADRQIHQEGAVRSADSSPEGPVRVVWTITPPRPSTGEATAIRAVLVDAQSGDPVSGVDVGFHLFHQEDREDLLRLRSYVRNNEFSVQYTFPEGGAYRLGLYVAPTPRSSKVFFPFTHEAVISIDPGKPDASSQWRAFLLLTGLGWTGVFGGFVFGRHRAKRFPLGR